VLILLVTGNVMAAVKMDMEQARFNMIEQQIRPWEVLDPEVLGSWQWSGVKFLCLRRSRHWRLPTWSCRLATVRRCCAEDRSACSPGSGRQEHRYRARGRYRQRLHGRTPGVKGRVCTQRRDRSGSRRNRPAQPAAGRGKPTSASKSGDAAQGWSGHVALRRDRHLGFPAGTSRRLSAATQDSAAASMAFIGTKHR
jgi:hypothetical protein